MNHNVYTFIIFTSATKINHFDLESPRNEKTCAYLGIYHPWPARSQNSLCRRHLSNIGSVVFETRKSQEARKSFSLLPHFPTSGRHKELTRAFHSFHISQLQEGTRSSQELFTPSTFPNFRKAQGAHKSFSLLPHFLTLHAIYYSSACYTGYSQKETSNPVTHSFFFPIFFFSYSFLVTG